MEHTKEEILQDLEVCKYCKHCHPCKVLIDKKWIRFEICTVLLDGKEREHALVVTDNDRCEMFTPKGERNNNERNRQMEDRW